MPPPTPSTAFMQLFAAVLQQLGGVAGRIFVLHQSPPDLFHRRHGRLLGTSGQKGTRAILQLPRPLGGDNNKPVGAQLRIVRNRILSIVSGSFSHFFEYLNFQNSRSSKLSMIGRTSWSMRTRRNRSAITIDSSLATDCSISWLIRT